jgi:hypothetical protein
MAVCLLVDSNTHHNRHFSTIHPSTSQLPQEEAIEEAVVSSEELISAEFDKREWAEPSAEWR